MNITILSKIFNTRCGDIMLTYNLSKRDNTPIYEYLYQCIRDDILSGRIKANEKLPSKREMSKNHNISVITVENAYGQLLVEGYIYAKEKRGYFAGDFASGYVKASKKRDTVLETDKKQWLVDFHSNHIRYDSFPFATWSKVMRQTLLDEENSFLTSPPHAGVPPLREAIAEHLRQFRGMDVDPNNIVVGAGTEYLYSLIVQLLGRDKIIALEDPGYRKIYDVYLSNGVKCKHISLDDEGIDIKKLKSSKADIVHISPSHHFPTGKVMPIGRRHEILQWANDNNSYIVEDDYDSEFRFQGRPIPTMAGIDDRRVIYMNTFSKTLAPSIRIAYMVLPQQLMDLFEQKLGFYSGTVSGFEQYTLANFIRRGYYERHINRMRNYYKDYRNKIIQMIKQSPIYKKVTIEEENAGLHFILGIPENVDYARFDEILKQNNIRINTVADYCYNNIKQYQNKLIINYSDVPEEKMKKALSIMNKALEESVKK